MAPGRDDDPLSRVLAPPPGETAADREARLVAEAEAKRISDAIDEELQQQAKVDRKIPKPMKMLLLGEYPCAWCPSGNDSHTHTPLQVRVNLVRKEPVCAVPNQLLIIGSNRQIHNIEKCVAKRCS